VFLHRFLGATIFKILISKLPHSNLFKKVLCANDLNPFSLKVERCATAKPHKKT
jgi:hypothetical protein